MESEYFFNIYLSCIKLDPLQCEKSEKKFSSRTEDQ